MIERPSIVRQITTRTWEARIPIEAYGNQQLPANRGTFTATRSDEWVASSSLADCCSRDLEQLPIDELNASTLEQAGVYGAVVGIDCPPVRWRRICPASSPIVIIAVVSIGYHVNVHNFRSEARCAAASSACPRALTHRGICTET